MAWGARKVPSITSSRPIISRKYFYRSEVMKNWPQAVNLNLLEEACKLFVGTHDFTNLCRLKKEKSSEECD